MNHTATRMTALVRILALCALCLASASCSRHQARGTPTSIDAPNGTENSPADLYIAIAAEYSRLGQTEAALKNAEKAIAADQRNSGGYYMLALIYQRIGETALAEENFKRALELTPRSPDVLDAYGSFFCTLRRYPEAQAQYAKALANPLYKTPWFSLTNAGNCALSAGDAAAAETFYQRALTANPKYGPALYMLAAIEFNRNNAKAAKAYLRRYLDDYLRGVFTANADTFQALLLAIKTERKLGNVKGAETYEQVLRDKFPSESAAPGAPSSGPPMSPSR